MNFGSTNENKVVINNIDKQYQHKKADSMRYTRICTTLVLRNIIPVVTVFGFTVDL